MNEIDNEPPTQHIFSLLAFASNTIYKGRW